jgi:hypothetical protein
MPIPSARRPTVRIDGVVRRVDTVGRELHVQVAGSAVTFDVPPGCPITLRGERVKFRLVQPRDRVRVAYTVSHERRVADAVDVQPVDPPAP